MAVKTSLMLAAEAAPRSVVFVPCPIARDGFAGWAIQVRRIAERNPDNVAWRFVYDQPPPSRSFGRVGQVVAAFRYASHCRRAILRTLDPVTVLFPVFFLLNVLLACSLPKHIPYVVRISGGELDRGNIFAYCLRLAMIRRATHVIALNRTQYDKLAKIGVGEATRHFIPVSVSPEFRKPTAAEYTAARGLLGLGSDQLVVGCVGLLSERKQQRILIEAVGRLGRNDVVVILCGPESGGEASASYAAACRADAARLNVPLITTGRRDDVRAILWALDIFVLASRQEGMPNSLLEALACGLPCIGSDIPGVRQVLADGANGRLFPPGDVDALSTVLAAPPAPEVDADPVAAFRADIVDRRVMQLLLSTAGR